MPARRLPIRRRPARPWTLRASGGGAPASSVDFGRIFPSLPPFAEANDTVRAALLEVGHAGRDLGRRRSALGAGPKALIVDPTVNGNPTATQSVRDEPRQPDDDGRLDVRGAVHRSRHHLRSDLAARRAAEPADLAEHPHPGARPRFGVRRRPGSAPDLYVDNPDGSVGPKLKIGTGGVHEDVPRIANGDGTYTALLGDPRNDENVIDRGPALRAHPVLQPRARRARRARPRALPSRPAVPRRPGQQLRRVSPGARGDAVALPVAARERAPAPDRRAGMSSTTCSRTATASTGRRPATRSCRSSSAPPPTGSATAWFAPPTARTSPAAPATARAPPPTRSSRLCSTRTSRTSQTPSATTATTSSAAIPAPRRYVGWQTFFDLGDGNVKNNKKIDTTISSVLFTLPVPAIAPHTQTSPTVLPQRNLLRQLTWGLPSGQAVARAMGAPALGPSDLGDIAERVRPVRHQHAALVLHPGRGQGDRRRTESRTRWAGGSSPRR